MPTASSCSPTVASPGRSRRPTPMRSPNSSPTWGTRAMLRFAVLSARGRVSTFLGALVALVASSALVVAGAMPLEAALKTHPPVERYHAAAAVVTGHQIVGADHDVVLTERARVPAALAA